MRTPKESATIIEKTITEIRSSGKITDKLISKTSKKYDINENHIRTVMGYKKLK